MLYLAHDGHGNRGPHIGDAAWQALWARYFSQHDRPSTSVYKPPTASAPSRRSSTVAPDSFAGASVGLHSHGANLSRSTLADGSSNRVSIPHVSARPSPRLDASADWSPFTPSAAWSAHGSSSAGRITKPLTPFPQLPILARIEWHVDPNKASWWPGWIASRNAMRERPSHKSRKSMHLAANLPQTKTDGLGVHDADHVDHVQDDQDDHVNSHATTHNLDPQVPPTSSRDMDMKTIQMPPLHLRAVSPAHTHLAEAQLPTSPPADAMPSTVQQADMPEYLPSLPLPESTRSSLSNHAFQQPVEKQEHDQIALSARPTSGRRSPSDEPVRSARASIVSMSSYASRCTASVSHADVHPAPNGAPDTAPSASSIAAPSRSASLEPHRDASNHSRTGYSELLDANYDDDQVTDRDAEYSLEAPTAAHDAPYSALPDSPSFGNRAVPEHQVASDHEEDAFSQPRFPLRDSFIVDAGDELMWRDLHHHAMHPRLGTQTQPAEDDSPNSQHRAEHAQTEVHLHALHLQQSTDHNLAADSQSRSGLHRCASEAIKPADSEEHHYQHSATHPGHFAYNVYNSPQCSNMARIQSWIGKTPTGRPNSSGAFDEYHFDRLEEDQQLQMPNESDIDEVVDLWASRIRQDPFAIPHISAPTASVSGDDNSRALAVQQDSHQEKQDQAIEPRNGESSTLTTTPAPASSLLSPIHLDAVSFDGVKPQLGNLAVTSAPQLLSPTAVAGTFSTPRASSSQRSVSTPAVHQHPPSSPASLVPPLDHRPSSASRRSSGDLSDTLEEMQKAVELLSPACLPNPALGQSPDPHGRKMSSRDSLAYARSLSASVTPSPKWFARAKATSAKSRSKVRSTFVAGGSTFDRGLVSPRPASTSAMSSSRSRSPALQAPLSASRLIEFARLQTKPRLARTEVDEAESTRSGHTARTISDDLTKPVTALVTMPDASVAPRHDVLPSRRSPSVAGETVQTEPVTAATPKAVERELHQDEHDASDESGVPALSPALASVKSVASSESAKKDETRAGEDSLASSAFMSDNDEDNIARIQHFLRGKVMSGAASDASISHDLSYSLPGHQGSSADGTIIERSISLESDLAYATPKQPAVLAEASNRVAKETDLNATQPDANLRKGDSPIKTRWSQASYVTGAFSSPRASAYTLNSSSRKEELHPEERSPSFTYDGHLGSEPITLDTQLSSAGASADVETLSRADQAVKSSVSTSPSDEAFFMSNGPIGTSVLQPVEPRPKQQHQQHQQHHQQQQPLPATMDASGQNAETKGQHQPTSTDEPNIGDAIQDHARLASESTTRNGLIPVLACQAASSPVHLDLYPVHSHQLAGAHDDTLGEDEIRTMNEDTRAAVREALSQSTGTHHINMLPGTVPISSCAAGGSFSPKSSASPTASPLSSHSSLGDQFRRRGSASSLNLTSTGGGSESNASSPNLFSNKRRPARLNVDIDGLPRSPPSNATSAKRLPSTSPRSRFAQLPPSPSLHPSYKAAMSSPLSQSFPVMGMGSPQSKPFLPSLASVTSLQGELAG